MSYNRSIIAAPRGPSERRCALCDNPEDIVIGVCVCRYKCSRPLICRNCARRVPSAPNFDPMLLSVPAEKPWSAEKMIFSEISKKSQYFQCEKKDILDPKTFVNESFTSKFD